jgi:DNA-binding GntR family transcriptional regulator
MMIQTASLSEQIQRELKADILSGELLPGQRLGIEDLARRWNVSTSPVRDAINRLEAAGLVRVAPRRGVYVSTLDQRTFKHVFDLRIALECLAIESATELIPDDEIRRTLELYREASGHFHATGDDSLLVEHDSRVHDLIIEYCDNPKLVEIMQGLNDLIEWARNTVVQRQPNSYVQAFPEHLKILESLEARNPAAAEKALREHLTNAFELTVHNVNQDTRRAKHSPQGWTSDIQGKSTET